MKLTTINNRLSEIASLLRKARKDEIYLSEERVQIITLEIELLLALKSEYTF